MLLNGTNSLSQNGHVNCLKWLVEESSAYVELAVRDGQTSLLHHAASEGMEQCLTYLLAFMAKRKITTGIMKYIIKETSQIKSCS